MNKWNNQLDQKMYPIHISIHFYVLIGISQFGEPYLFEKIINKMN